MSDEDKSKENEKRLAAVMFARMKTHNKNGGKFITGWFVTTVQNTECRCAVGAMRPKYPDILSIVQEFEVSPQFIEALIHGFDSGENPLHESFLTRQSEAFHRGLAKGREFHKWVTDQKLWIF